MILISLDTLRADHVSSYGYERETTPNLDRLAKDGARFSRAFSVGGATLPTHMSMMTGLGSHAHDVTSETKNALPSEIPMLAELLLSSGYQTAAFVGGAYVQKKWGFDRGFETFEQGDVTFRKILPRARAWLDHRGPEPFFLFLHSLDVHSGIHEASYDAPPAFLARFADPEYSGSFTGCRAGKCASEFLVWFNQAARRGEIDRDSFLTESEVNHIVAQYDASIAYVDSMLGDFFEYLRGEDLYEDSLIIVASDHGEEFLEHGMFLHHQNHEEIVRVPLILKLPANAEAGTLVEGLVSVMDIMPTVLAQSNAPRPAELQGKDLVPVVQGHRQGHSEILIAGGAEKLRTERWSLLTNREGPIALFDLDRDPGETENVLEQRQPLARELYARLRSIRSESQLLGRRLRQGATQEPIHLDEKTARGLRALGYVE